MAEKDDAIVIITGRDGVMSGGFDLKEMGAGPMEALVLTSLGSKFARRDYGPSTSRDYGGDRPHHCDGRIPGAGL